MKTNPLTFNTFADKNTFALFSVAVYRLTWNVCCRQITCHSASHPLRQRCTY